MHIFPGVGLGVIACSAKHVTDEMILVAARTLAQHVSYADLAQGHVYPPLPKIRTISAAIAVEVADVSYKRGIARKPVPPDLAAEIQANMYYPEYRRFA